MKTNITTLILAGTLGMSMQAGAVQAPQAVIGLWDQSMDYERDQGTARAFGASADVLANAGIETVGAADTCTTTSGLTGPVAGAVYRTTTRKMRFKFQTIPSVTGGAKYSLTLNPISLTTDKYPDYTNATNLTNYADAYGNFNAYYGTTNFKFPINSSGNVLFNYIGANDDCYRFPNIEKFGFGVANGTGANSANKYLVAGYSSHGFYASSVSNVWTRYNTSRFGVYVYTLPGSAIAADTTLAITASKVFVPLDATYGELIPSLSGIGAYAFNGLVGDMLRITYQKDVTGGIQWIYMYYSLPTFGYLGMQSTTIYNP